LTISGINRQTENQVTKALNRSALIIFAARIIVFIIYAFMHLWGLMGAVFFGAILWFWIYRTTDQRYLNLAFFLGILESGIFCTFSTAALGWDVGAFFSLIVFLPIILINSRVAREIRIALCIFIIMILLFLFASSKALNLDALTPAAFKDLLFGLNLIEGCGILMVITTTVEEVKLSSQEEIVLANEQLMTLANTDPLTNLLNRRIMMTRLQEEKESTDRTGQPFSLIMLDVDNFKQINDEYGHDGGDFVLISVAEKIKLGLRKNDLVARWGGDEFLIMLPEVALVDSEAIGEKIRQRVVNSPFIYHELDIPVTVTLGISQCDKDSGIGNCIRKADLALYKGKQGGKNRLASIK